MTLRGAIGSLATGTYVVSRATAGTRTAGKYISGPSALVVPNDVVEAVDPDADALTLTAHVMQTGDGPLQTETTDTLPAGLGLVTNYWAVKDEDDANKLRLAASLANAMAVPPIVVDITDEGIGVHTIVDTPDTKRQNRVTFAIVASIQPVRGRELADLPEGQRGDEIKVVYTTTEVQTRMPGFEPDVITIDGEPWTLIRSERWESFGSVHWRAYCARTALP